MPKTKLLSPFVALLLSMLLQYGTNRHCLLLGGQERDHYKAKQAQLNQGQSQRPAQPSTSQTQPAAATPPDSATSTTIPGAGKRAVTTPPCCGLVLCSRFTVHLLHTPMVIDTYPA
ncbi:uncharacterized protein EDB91DRAFT_501635 [Suillus paluster]|uniref:uncharacterized protein n=1 Tax=Suillus paluster TaxID=48578 RepID=UPI001B861186|nr:uncharacterized protein EDB91DRAFT_501635 [Suillus paluster]KAG1736676.1 hypothetical protein EDB91DRAFT_501635 [Suillus paluster]